MPTDLNKLIKRQLRRTEAEEKRKARAQWTLEIYSAALQSDSEYFQIYSGNKVIIEEYRVLGNSEAKIEWLKLIHSISMLITQAGGEVKDLRDKPA